MEGQPWRQDLWLRIASMRIRENATAWGHETGQDLKAGRGHAGTRARVADSEATVHGPSSEWGQKSRFSECAGRLTSTRKKCTNPSLRQFQKRLMTQPEETAGTLLTGGPSGTSSMQQPGSKGRAQRPSSGGRGSWQPRRKHPAQGRNESPYTWNTRPEDGKPHWWFSLTLLQL